MLQRSPFKKPQTQTPTKKTQTDWRTELAGIASQVKVEMKSTFESSQHTQDADFKAFQKAETECGKIAGKTVELKDAPIPEVVGPLSLALASKELALLEEFNPEKISTSVLHPRQKWQSPARFDAASARARQLQAAIEGYKPQQAASTSLSTTASTVTTSTTSSTAAPSLPNMTSTTYTIYTPPTPSSSAASSPSSSPATSNDSASPASSSSSSGSSTAAAPKENKSQDPKETLKKLYGESIVKYLEKSDTTTDEKNLDFSTLGVVENNDEIEFCAKSAAILVANPNTSAFLSNLIVEIKSKIPEVKTTDSGNNVSTTTTADNSSATPTKLDEMHTFASELITEANTILDDPSTSLEDKQKMAKSLVKMLAVLRDPTNEAAIKKVQEDAKQTIGASSPLKKFFGILALIGLVASMFLSGGKSVAAGYLLTAGKVTLAGTAATLFYFGSEGKFAAKEREFAEAAENNNKLRTR